MSLGRDIWGASGRQEKQGAHQQISERLRDRLSD